MTHEEEILYRKKLMSEVRAGNKLTAEERIWLATHRIYNRCYGYPYFNTDIIELCANTNYHIRVRIEHIEYNNLIIPVIAVPAGKGKIITDFSLTDCRGNVSLNKPVKMLALLLDSNNREAEFDYNSNLGTMSISYECEYYDNRQHLIMREHSNFNDYYFAMFSEIISSNKMLYHCKAPVNDNFQSLVFSVEWNPK